MSASLAAHLDLTGVELPERGRTGASLTTLDVPTLPESASDALTSWVAEKARYVGATPAYRQVLVLPGERDEVADEDGVRWYRLRGSRVPMQRDYRLLFADRSLRRIIAHERPDIIEVGSPYLLPWVADRARRGFDIPLAGVFDRGLPRLFCPGADTTGLVRHVAAVAAGRYARRLDRLLDATVVSSRYVEDALRRAGCERLVRVPLGVDLAFFHPRRRAAADATRRIFGIPDGPVALFVGRLVPGRDLGVLLAAWEEVERRTGAYLVLAHEGPLSRVLRRGCGARRVLWLPFLRGRDTIAALLASVDLVVSPSSAEPFGTRTLEALACGTPVLSAHRGGVAEEVTASGGGALFSGGNVGHLADAAGRLLRADLPALGARGRAHVELEHDWTRTFGRLFALYADLARGREPSLVP